MKSYMCLVQWIIDGSTLYGIPFMWQARSPEEAAQQAARMMLGPNHQRYRITVCPFEQSESFRWTGDGEVQNERVKDRSI